MRCGYNIVVDNDLWKIRPTLSKQVPMKAESKKSHTTQFISHFRLVDSGKIELRKDPSDRICVSIKSISLNGERFLRIGCSGDLMEISVVSLKIAQDRSKDIMEMNDVMY